jgi:RimJ/RimL family protein N-acetyltransferase
MTPATIDVFEQWAGMSPGLLQGWEPHGVYRDGELAGIGVVHGKEIHFAAAPEWRGRLMLRGVVRNFLGRLFDDLGFLTTRVQCCDQVSQRFVQRLGFEFTGSDETFHYYMLSALPYTREN